MDYKIEIWPIEKLVFYARNPRKNDAAVGRMCASLLEFGFKIPVLARSDGEVVDGHLRLKAARRLGIAEVPVILCDEWTPAQVKAFRLMVNRSVAWADWDDDLLSLELIDLKLLDFDLSLTGFDEGELADLLTQNAADGLTDEDAVPELPETPVSVPGDLWILGDHRLLVGDATHADAVARLMSGAPADLVFTDPPYNVSYEGYTEDRLTIKDDRMSDAEFKLFLEAAFRSYRTLVKPGASMYLCHSSSGSANFRTRWRPPASRFAVRSFGRRTPSRGVSDVTNSSTSRCSTPTSP